MSLYQHLFFILFNKAPFSRESKTLFRFISVVSQLYRVEVMDSECECVLDRLKNCKERLTENKISITEDVVFAYEGLYLSIHPLYDTYNLFNIRIFKEDCKFILLSIERFRELFQTFTDILEFERTMIPYNLHNKAIRNQISARKIDTKLYILFFPLHKHYYLKNMCIKISQIEKFVEEMESIELTLNKINSELKNLMNKRFSNGVNSE